MVVAFWLALGLTAYTYFGYIGLLFLRSRLAAKPVAKAPIEPAVTILMAVRNEAGIIARKLQNIAELHYPQDKIQIVVASDGSTDATNEILSANPAVVAVALLESGGKALALNEALKHAEHEIVVFTDARQMIEPDALRLLLSNFADTKVGCASGELMLEESAASSKGEGMGLYWKMEKKLRTLESETGSVVGVTGAFYAARRELLVPLPANTILDDVYTPMHIVKAGYRVVFEPSARAWDVAPTDPRVEFRRKVRTLTGNYQLVRLAPWTLSFGNPIWFALVSHKLLRLAVPFFLLVLLFSAACLPAPFYRWILWAQLMFYALGCLGIMGTRLGPLGRITNIAGSFLVLNSAAMAAFFNAVKGKTNVWVR